MGRAGRRDIIPFSGWTTTATLSSRPALLISTRVLYHVFDNVLYRARLLEPLATEPHLQPHHVAPTLQFLPLYPDLVDLRDLSPVTDNFGPQGAVTHAPEGVAHMLGRRKVQLQHPHRLVGEGLDLLRPVIGCRVQLASIVRSVGGEASYNVRVTSHIDLDVSGWCGAPEPVGDGERNRLVPLVDLKVLRDEDRRLLSSLLSACGVVARWSRSVVARLSSDSCLTSSTSSSYRHPLGRVGRRYGAGIFVVLLDGRGQLIDQCDGVFTREAKSCQVGRARGRLSTQSERSSRRLVRG